MAIRKYRINPHTGKLDRVATPEEIAGDYMEHEDFDTDSDAIIDKAENVDDGEGNASTASQVKDAVLHKDLKDNPHEVELTDFGIATGTVGSDIDDAVSHKDLTDNPHTVTVEQLGLATGISASDIDDAITHKDLIDNPHVVTVAQLDLATGTVASDVDDAVTKKHTQNSDTKLDDGESNEVTSADLRGHLDSKANPHSVELIDFGIGTGITGADIDDVISKEHEHSNKTELDKVTDGDHDVIVTGNPHDVKVEQLDLATGTVASDVDDAVTHKDLTNNPHVVTTAQIGLEGTPIDIGCSTGITASDIDDAVAHIILTDNPHTVTVDQLDLATGTVASDVDDAVTKKHTQNTDVALRTDKLTVDAEGNATIVGELKIKIYEQDTEPDVGDQRLAMWIDTSTGGGTYLLFRRGTGDQVSVELA